MFATMVVMDHKIREDKREYLTREEREKAVRDAELAKRNGSPNHHV